MEATHQFASTQPLNPLESAQSELDGASVSTYPRWLYATLYHVPSTALARWLHLLRPRFALTLMAPLVAGLLLGSWFSTPVNWPTIVLLVLAGGLHTFGMVLLHEWQDYTWAQANTKGELPNIVFATPYHLMVNNVVSAQNVQSLARGLLLFGGICYAMLGLIAGWHIWLLYALSLLLGYAYNGTPVHYSYRGWGLGELGLFVCYGLVPMAVGYSVTGQRLDLIPAVVSVPFGLMVILLFANYNFIHQRRDRTMHKRTLVVVFGLLRILDINSLLTILIYAMLVCLVSLAYLPMSALVALAALPVAIRVYGQVRLASFGLEESYLLYHTTVMAMLLTTMLFCAALLVDLRW